MLVVETSSTLRVKCTRKGKVHCRTGHEGTEGEIRYSSTLTLTSTLDGGGWLRSRPGRFTSGKEARWARGPVWTGAETVVLTGIRSPDRPVKCVRHRFCISGLRPARRTCLTQ